MALGGLKKAIVVGGSGALGRSLVLSMKGLCEVTSIDLTPNTDAHKNIQIDANQTIDAQHTTVLRGLEGKYGAIMCVAGGFVAGNVTQIDIFSQWESMLKMNLQPSLLTAYIATRHLDARGLLVLTGAAVPFTETCPQMLAYALSKSTVHSLATNMAERKDIPEDSSVVTILPEMIDTPKNREVMKNADATKWLDPVSIAALLKMWAEGFNRPANGSFAILKKSSDCVIPEFV